MRNNQACTYESFVLVGHIRPDTTIANHQCNTRLNKYELGQQCIEKSKMTFKTQHNSHDSR